MKIIIKCHTVEILVLAIILAFKVFWGMHIKEMAKISKLHYYFKCFKVYTEEWVSSNKAQQKCNIYQCSAQLEWNQYRPQLS